MVQLEQLLKVGSEESLVGFINDLYEKSTPENANLLMFQIIATVCRVVGSVSDGTDTMKLFGVEFHLFAYNVIQQRDRNEKTR